MTAETRRPESTSPPSMVYLALELSDRQWHLVFTTGLGQKRWRRTVRSWAWKAVLEALAEAKRQLRVAAETPVRSCYEAGREAFVVHRFLQAHGVDSVVIDPTSLRVDRRARRRKTDRLDGDALLTALIQFTAGDEQALRPVRPPSRAQEDERHRARELEALTAEHTAVTNQIGSLLVTHGLQLRLDGRFLDRVAAARDWAQQPLPPVLHGRFERLWERRQLIARQIRTLERAIRIEMRTSTALHAQPVRTLQELRGIGLRGSLTLMHEVFWRDFGNRREVGGYLGLGGAPYQSGTQARDQGISKHGNRHARRVLIPLAWGWLRHQPHSELSQWFRARFAHGSAVQRRIGIVALARRLAIALWRWLKDGVIPAGAHLKPVRA